jgi:hypothetical protein
MSKISPRLNYREAQTGTDEGRKRQNVFNPNLFADTYADDLKDKKLESKAKDIFVHECRKRELSSLSIAQSSAVNDVVAKKITPKKDRFCRSLDAKALTEVVGTVPLPYTIAICGQG